MRTADGAPAVLKVACGDDETEHEHLALQRWGAGAVRLLRADPHRRALLLERLASDDLADARVPRGRARSSAGLYARLHVPAPPQLRTTTSYVARWPDDLAACRRDAPIPRRLVEQALRLGRATSSADPASTGTLVHGDLHDHNVLAAEREPWLVIDPQPMSRRPALRARAAAVEPLGGDRGRRRPRAACAAASTPSSTPRASTRTGPGPGWSCGWSSTRTGPSRTPQRPGRALDRDERDWITRCITVVKAVQD